MKLAAALSSLIQALGAQGVRFVVVGGLAASARGEARFTRDVDVAVAVETDLDAEAVVFSLKQAGYASPKRPRDLEDIRAILRENPSFDEPLVRELLTAIERRGYARGQLLSQKWSQIRVDLGA